MGAETREVDIGDLQRKPVASMRPRHDGRGNTPPRKSRSSARRCFNEAAPRWARKWTMLRSRTRQETSFNEAAPRWARKRTVPPSRLTNSTRFNEAAPRWARKQRLGQVAWRKLGRASMRPRHDGRGNLATVAEKPARGFRFNEAAPRWARKPAGNADSTHNQVLLQ